MQNPKSGQDSRFDFERLIVFRKALAVFRLLSGLIQRPPRKASDLVDHLDRAASSVLLNLAEGSGKEPGSRDRKRFYRTALGSAKEAGACLILLKARGIVSPKVLHEGKALLLEVVAMLTVMAR
jgi:four helix bundle protein